MPGHQRRIVVSAEIVPVFYREESAGALGKCLGRRQHPVWKNILFYPPIGREPATAGADRVQQKQAF